MHVVAHTHWDREWYHTAARFQTRLSRLVTDLLDLLRQRPELPSFLLDGQAVMLGDYLSRHPEQAAAVSRLLAERRLECGPWYVLLILRGFDIPTAILWRGFGGEPGQEGDLYRWRAADGSEVLLVHLPQPGYEFGANLPAEPAQARARWERRS